MMHINDISWAQLILIEVGAMFQIAALCAFIKETAKPAGTVAGAREARFVHHEETKCRLPDVPIPAQVIHHHRELHGVMEDAPAGVSPGKLAKTSKVNFKQTLKIHKEERPFVPSVRW
jgi:hypothetical protein